MAEQGVLFDKTFDQQVALAGADVESADISPNRRIAAEVVFEPLQGGVRVTARDESHRMLWGFVGSKEMLGTIHCPVAIYDTLRSLLGEELVRNGLPAPAAAEDMQAARDAIENLRETISRLEETLDVKKESSATHTRAKEIARALADARSQIHLEVTVPEKKADNVQTKAEGRE